MNRILRLLCLILSVFGLAQAKVVNIISATQLEMRNIDLDGKKQEYIILTGTPVKIQIDDSTLEAQRIEFNKTDRTMRLIGQGIYTSRSTSADGISQKQEFRGEDLRVDLKQEGIIGENVVISTQEILVTGEEARRLPGQIQVQTSFFTPCGRCGQAPYDYAFRAKSLLIYPGDRLIAQEVTVLIANAPVFYLPLAVLFLNDPSRQPRLEFKKDAVDGRTLVVDLPYTLGNNQLGFNYLRFYENRPNPWGFGVSHNIYRLFDSSDIVNSSLFLIPKKDKATYDWNYYLNYKATPSLPLSKSGLNVELLIHRRDTAPSANRNLPVQGNLQPLETSINLKASTAFKWFSTQFNFQTYLDHDSSSIEQRIHMFPELTLNFENLQLGGFSFRPSFVFGNYTAPINTTNRSAVLAAKDGSISAQRIKYQQILSANFKLWSGAQLTASNSFTGQYYSTDEVLVNYDVNANFTQTIDKWFNFSAGYTFALTEGETPFAFDLMSARAGSHTTNASLSLTPADWFKFDVRQSYLLHKPYTEQPDLSASFVFSPKELSFSSRLNYTTNLFLGKARSLEFSGNYGLSTTGLNLAVSGGYDYYDTNNAPKMKYRDLSVSGSLRSSNNNYNLSTEYLYDLNKQLSKSVSVRTSYTNFLNDTPYTISAAESYNFETPNTAGNFSVSYNDFTFKVDHNFLLYDPKNTNSLTGTLNFNLTKGSWIYTYGGTYDLKRNGYTAPEFSINYRDVNKTEKAIDFNTTIATPGLDQPEWYVKSAQIKSIWQWNDQFATSADIGFIRQKNTDGYYDTINVNQIGLTYAWGNIGSQPQWIFNTKLTQKYNFSPKETSPLSIKPSFSLVYNRCCWSAKFEYNMDNGSWKVGINLLGSDYHSLLDTTAGDIQVLPDIIGGF